jgi:iron transport multicopper oxidase
VNVSLIKAVLRYAGAPDAEPTVDNSTTTVKLVEENLHALINPGSVAHPTILNPDPPS